MVVGHHLSPTPGRLASRASERGAVIFVVLLVLTVLTAIGVFAARMAGLNQRVAGYDRQSTQTGYVAEYGATALASELAGPRKQAYTDQMKAASDTCAALQNLPNAGAGYPCYQVRAGEFEKRLEEDGLTGVHYFDPSGSSFNAAGQSVSGDFRVEMTDPGPAPGTVPGTESGGLTRGFSNMQFTLTTIGQVRPSSAAGDGGTCTDPSEQESAQVSGTRSARVYITVPYVSQ